MTKQCTMCSRRARLRALDRLDSEHGTVIDYLSLKKSYKTFTTDVTSAYFHVGRGRRMSRGPAEWLGQQAALGNPTSVLWRLRKQLNGWRRSGTRWVGTWQNPLKSRVSTGVTQHHNSLQIMSWMFSLRYTWRISKALDRGTRWTWSKPTSHRKSVSESGQCTKWARNTNTSRVSECCTMTGLRSHPTKILGSSVAQHEADELQTSTNAECNGIRQT